MLIPRHPIGQAARRAGVSVRTIVNYEKKGLIDPARDTGGRRLFSDEDIKEIRSINLAYRKQYPALVGA